MAAHSNFEKIWDESITKFDRATRPLHKKQFQCALKCTENENLSAEEFTACIQQCQQPLARFGEVFNREIQAFQDRYLRCVRDCQDDMKTKVSSDQQDLTPEQRRELEKCADACSEKQAKLVPGFFDRMYNMLQTIDQ